MPELLSPAGNMDSLRAAVLSGADAVYLGYKDFSARAGAENFDKQTLRDAVNFCAGFGVKVYVTLNTLLTDRELPEVRGVLIFLAELGIDGIIVQDMAVARLARQIVPDLPLHASTQMTVHSLSGAKALEKAGFCRAVLARELSLEQIAYITAHTSLETEVFVHGALCMCYSGHCYFSSVIGRKSGNRGRCAQPCRLPYNDSYPLSLKDLNLLDHLDKLTSAGVASLKIEGRLKSKEYVSAVTRAYVDALNGKAPDQATHERLATIFSRDGFTDGYLINHLGKAMFGTKQKTAYSDYKNAVSDISYQPFKRFDLRVRANAIPDTPVEWEFSDGTHSVTLIGAIAQTAQNAPLTRDTLRQKLDKLTDTPYRLQTVSLKTDGDIFLPISAINDARRKGLDALNEARIQAHRPHAVLSQPSEHPVTAPLKEHSQILFYDSNALPSTDLSRFARVWLRPEQIDCYHGDNRGAFIDHFADDAEVDTLIQTLKTKQVQNVLVGNIGHIAPFKDAGFCVWGDYSLNITNTESLTAYKEMGLESACLSFELNLPQIRDMIKVLPSTIIGYGRLPLMQFKNCAIRNTGSCIHHKGFAKLKDRTGADFLLQCRQSCGNTLLNSLPLYIGDMLNDTLGLSGIRLDFTDETSEQTEYIINHFDCLPNGNFTRGLYARGVI